MAILWNKRKLAAVWRDTQGSARNGQSQNTLVTAMTGEYITQVSEEVEESVPEKLSQEFSRAESRILGALSKLKESFLIPQVRTCSRIVLGTSRYSNSENPEPTEFLPWLIPTPKWSSPFVRPALQLTHTGRRPLTLGMQDFTVCLSVSKSSQVRKKVREISKKIDFFC